MSVNALERRPRRAAFTIAAGLAAIGVVLIADAATLRQTGGYSGFGPAAVPRIVGGGLIGLGLWTAIAARRGDAPRPPRQEPVPVLWVLGGLLALLALLHLTGFIVAAALLFAMTARGFGQRDLALALVVGLALTTVVYGVFDRLLRLNLPGGPLEDLIFATVLPAVVGAIHALLALLPFWPAAWAPAAGI